MNDRDARIYSMLGKQVTVLVDRPIGYCHGDLLYPVNYGYIPELMAGDGEEQDAYILGIDLPTDRFDGVVIGGIRRRNDCEDKLIVAPAGMEFHQGQIMAATQFQEQFFETYVISLLRRSCGVLPYRVTEGQREYLLVFESFSQCWSIPKGHMEAGETEAETALRELYEETGLTAELDGALRAVIEYPIPPAGRKQLVFFPGKVSGSVRTADGEIDGFKWVTADQLQDHLFPDTCEACHRLIAALDALTGTP